MKFEIPFNKQIYKEQMELNFNTAWKDNLQKNKKRLFYGIPIVLIGLLIAYTENCLGFFFIGYGLHFLINFFDYNSYYKKSKHNYFDSTESEIKGQTNANENCIWEFNEEYFRYKDYRYDGKIKWKTFQRTRVIDNNLFIDLNVGYHLSYIIGEKEVGAENFQNIIAFVKQKIRNKTSI